ncbi:MAG: YkgJ family cysteine cluster protein [Sedimentisphaerales bacterium]|nr:YkgJ family cysteine cluster protein [Sedimentisphaerales bacterium]
MTYKEVIHISQIQDQDIVSRHKDNISTGNFDKNYNTCKEIIEFELEILGETVLFSIYLIPKMIKLSEIVPIAYEISSKISTIIQEKNINEGITIPCRKGCATCCNYLVPLSIPEAFYLRETVLSLPENTGNSVFYSFLTSAKCILNKKSEDLYSMELDQLSRWYSKLNLTCPFLSDNACSIYDKRPIACREHLVTGTNLFCKPSQEEESQKIELPVSILECLGKLSAELKQTDIEAIMMPLALVWTQDNPDSDIETWPSVEIIRRFTEIIKESCEIPCSASLC